MTRGFGNSHHSRLVELSIQTFPFLPVNGETASYWFDEPGSSAQARIFFQEQDGMGCMMMRFSYFNIAGTEFRTKRCNLRGVVISWAGTSEEKCFMFIRC